MNDDFRPLQDLTRLVLDTELAKLRLLSEESRLRRDEAARLDAACSARSAQMQGTDPMSDLAFRTGQDARWQMWIAGEKKRLMREAAEIAARREAQRKKAQRAFGKFDAVAGIRRLGEQERMLRAARRAQSSPAESGHQE